jgi:pyruvate,water dikinase
MPIRSLDQLTPDDVRNVGGKAWNCAHLRQKGFPVPDGLVVPAGAGDREIAALHRHPWFDKWPADVTFAVRSSGLDEDAPEQSFAGIHETRLDVLRAEVPAAVFACRLSARSPRARDYRAARGLPPDRSGIGILVQCMVRPISAGVAFTINPVTGDKDEMVINAAAGLGEALVSGLIEPDQFRIRKCDRRVVSPGAGGYGSGSATLNSIELAELAALLLNVERLYGAPQDIEWCRDTAQFWIVQSRPVTGVRSAASEPEWTRANLAEVLPELTSAQALPVFEEVLNVGERRYMGRLMAPESELGPVVKSFYGRPYLNLSQLRHVCRIVGAPPAAMMKSLGHAGDIDPADLEVGQASWRERLRCVPDIIRIGLLQLRSRRLFAEHERQIDAYLADLDTDPAALPDQTLWARIDQWRREAPATIEIVLLFGGVMSQEQPLRTICDSVGFPFERLLYSHLAAGERSVSAEQAYDLVQLAEVARADANVTTWLQRAEPPTLDGLRRDLAGTRFLDAFERFLRNYGHRGLYETDWALPRFSEDPGPLLQVLRLHVSDGGAGNGTDQIARLADEAAAIRADFERRFTLWRRWIVLPRARRLLATIKRYYLCREKCRSNMVRVIAAIRRWHLALADRFVDRGWIDQRDDYFLIRLDEIAEVLAGTRAGRELGRIVEERRAERERMRSLRLPLLMRESELPSLVRLSARAGPGGESTLAGLPVSRGSVEGEVVVIEDPADFSRMKQGAILVTRATDPSWTPLFTLAAGVIVEVGGMLSHASTIAREFGLPALANVKDATRRLRTGERVTLDADRGVVVRNGAGSI